MEKGILIVSKIAVTDYENECAETEPQMNEEWKLDGLLPMRDLNTSL